VKCIAAAGDGDGVLTFAEFKTAFLTGQAPPDEGGGEDDGGGEGDDGGGEGDDGGSAERRRRRRHLLSWVWEPGKVRSRAFVLCFECRMQSECFGAFKLIS
jgi:hypothetical protein